MTTKLYLDKRGIAPEEEAPVKIAINAFGSSVYIGTGVKVSATQWDAKAGKVIGHPLKARYNLELAGKKLDVDRALVELRNEGRLHGLTPSQVRTLVMERLDPSLCPQKPVLFMERFDAWTASKTKPGTRITYEVTARKIRAYDAKADTLRFEDITKRWLLGFDEFMAKTAPSANARNIHLRNIRTVFNDAIDEEVTTAYPFRKFRITPEPTRDRSLTRAELQTLFDYPCEPSQVEYRDMFKLVFLLCGINIGDLAAVREIINGRIDTVRSKTGQPISVAVLPEASRIIEAYRGSAYILNIGDRYADYRGYAHRVNDNLKKIGKKYNPHTKRWEGEPLFPDLSIYWARYSWATIAAELDVPERTIGAALGHSTRKSVTNIYTRNDMRKKVEEAQRLVAEYIFGASALV